METNTLEKETNILDEKKGRSSSELTVESTSLSEKTLETNETKPEIKYPILERRSVTIKNKIECKQDLIIKRLQTFYSKPGHIEVLLPIIKGESDISLRLVDYFVTNYAKKNNTNYIHKEKQFLVYFHYKRELKANSKKLFDPFCRRERIMFQINGNEPFITTVGQLNFFSWAIERGIVDYILENRIIIENDMNKTLKEHYSRSTHSSTGTTKSPLKITAVSNSSSTSNESNSSIVSDSTISHVSVSSIKSEYSESRSLELSSKLLIKPERLLSNLSGETTRRLSASSLLGEKETRRKRSELTTSAMKKVNIHECKTVISFD